MAVLTTKLVRILVVMLMSLIIDPVDFPQKLMTLSLAVFILEEA